ncbi:MAG: hypothetical protein QOG03_1681 [Actinomycetota bacterium]|jgi:hypothetical protein|nr:hypothetical protein [Actinomycetota bacterium]
MVRVRTSMTASRQATAGAELELLVLSPGRQGCAAVDLASGALVRAEHPPLESPSAPFDVVRASINTDEEPDEFTHPEVLTLADAPVRVRRLRGRQAERYLRPLLHPRGEPLLGFSGPAIPFWDLPVGQPSISLVDPESRPEVSRDAGGAWCRFRWRGVIHQLPLRGPVASRGSRALVSLTSPVGSHCYKVVTAVL